MLLKTREGGGGEGREVKEVVLLVMPFAASS